MCLLARVARVSAFSNPLPEHRTLSLGIAVTWNAGLREVEGESGVSSHSIGELK